MIVISIYNRISFKIFLVLVACCKSVIISSVSGPAKDKHWVLFGQYDSHKMAPNARIVYKDFYNRTILREHFLFFSISGKWMVSSNVNIDIVAYTP